MVPERFVVEYPERCLRLLELFEAQARNEKLLGSFALLVASAAFVIPYERLRARHPMRKPDEGNDLNDALRQMDRTERFLRASFWRGADPGAWRFTRIMNSPNNTEHWHDEMGVHPMSADAANSIERRKAGDVLRVIRNALAHGNVVYLNADGFERRGTEVQFLGFLSRYEEDEDQRARAETYRLVVTTEENFLRFTKKWAAWIASFPRDAELFEAA